MTATPATQALHEVESLLADHGLGGWPDSRLLEHFMRCHDGAAFAVLLHRHGPMVLRVCRGILRHCCDAEDAFQATFLVLACRAARVRNRSSVGGFLYGTACRVAARVRARLLRRESAEREAARMRAETDESEPRLSELEVVLHEELARLPENYRQVLVLCHLEGRTHQQAARELGWPAGSVSRHLRRAGELLRERLAGRGVAMPAAGSVLAGLAAPAPGAVPEALAQATLQAVGEYVAGSALVGGVGVSAVELAKEVLRAMSAFKVSGLAALALLLALVAGTATLFAGKGTVPPEQDSGPARPGQPGADNGIRPLPAVDRHGDPLPLGALARLGTTRLRHTGDVTALAFSPDGKALVSTGTDRKVRLWKIPGGERCGSIVNAEWQCPDAVAFSPDGRTLAEAGCQFVTLYDCHPARPGDRRPGAIGTTPRSHEDVSGAITFFAFLPGGDVVWGTTAGAVEVWEPNTWNKRRSFSNPAAKEMYHFALSPDGKLLAAGCRGPDVTLWDPARGERLGSLPGHEKIHSLAFAPDGRTLATGDAANTIRLWDLKERRVTARLVGVKAPHQVGGLGDAVVALGFTPDGKTLVSLGDLGDGTIRVWDVATRRERRRLQGPYGDGRLLALSPDGKTLAVTGSNHTVRLWDLTTGKELDGDLGSQGSVGAVAITPDSRQVAVGGSDGVVRLWDRATGKELRSFRAHQQQVASLAFSPDGSRLLSSGAFDAARLWDVQTGKEIRSFPGSVGNTHGVTNGCYSPDGSRVALATHGQAVQLADVATGNVERVVARGEIDRLALSPDGRLLAGGAHDSRVRVWDLATGKETWSAGTEAPTNAVAFSPDGRLVVAGTAAGKLFVWNATTGREVRLPQNMPGRDRAVAISPDARLLAVAGDLNVVLLYELATGQLVRTLTGHDGFVWSLAFAPDGRSLVSGSWDTTALVWDLTGRELATTQRGPLTAAELEARWVVLGKTDAAEAHKAVLSLANAPKQAVPLLRQRLAAEPPTEAKVIARWIAELDNDRFEVREAASRELARLGRSVEAELRRARATAPSPEARLRLDELLGKLGDRADEWLRGQRAVALLELAATAEARELLGQLAKAAQEELRGQARRALDRLAKRP
jgi:RNA polymerase sigma factor (sigma-70 family)